MLFVEKEKHYKLRLRDNMAKHYAETVVVGSERMESTQKLREVRFLWFFEVTKWEVLSTTKIGTDLHITTDRDIDNIYLNGELQTKIESV